MTHPAASTRAFLIPLAFLLGATSGAAQNHLAITPVTVIDVTDGSVRSNQTVLVGSNRITAVGPVDEVTVPKEAEIVDGADGYLIPGLWDMHVHSVANIAVDRSIESVAAWEWHFPLFLAHGVTGVRNMNDGTGDLTLELANSVKRRLTEGELAGPPRFLNSGPSLDGDPPLGSNSVVVRTAADARAAVQQLASHGADLVKPYENLSREAYFAIVDEARRQGLPVDGHVPFRLTPEEAAGAGQRTVEHPEGLAAGCSAAAEAERERFDRILSKYDRLPDDEKFLAQFRYYRALYDSWDPAACTSMIEAYRRNGVALAADLVTYHHVVHAQRVLSDTDGMRLVPHAIRRNWEAGLDSETIRKFQSILRPIVPLQAEQVRLFNEAGGMLLAATDVGVPFQVPGISLHEELALLVEAGLTPLEALGAATLNPARVLGLVDSLGTVDVGKLADLVLLEANPLEDITNTQRIRAVVADGRLYRRAELDRLLAEVEEVRREAPGGGTPHSTTSDPLAAALELVGCARESAAAVGESVWPGWGEAPSSVLLVAGETEYLICPSAAIPAEGFVEVPSAGGIDCPVLTRDARFDEGLLATFPALSPEPTIVVGTPEATGKEPGRWLATLLHEHFHQLQYSRPWYYEKVAELGLSGGDETGMWMLNYPFPYEDPEVEGRFSTLSQALGEALDARGSADFAGALGKTKSAWRELRDQLEPDDYSYLQFQIWQEGVARYVELRAAEALAAESPECLRNVAPSMAAAAAEIREEIASSLRNPALPETKRVAFYAVGAAVALLLDETSPGWKADYFRRPFAVGGFFAP